MATGRELQAARTCFPLPLPFTATGHGRHESDYMLRPVGPLPESLDLGVALGTPNVVSDPRISCLLSEFMTLWRAILNLKEGESSDISPFLAETSLDLSQDPCRSGVWVWCVWVCSSEFQISVHVGFPYPAHCQALRGRHLI